jgi:hypothetical protein
MLFFIINFTNIKNYGMNQRVLASLIAVILLTACSPNKLKVDISGIKTPPIPVMRLEEEMFSMTPDNFNQKSAKIKSTYGTFYEHYVMNLFKRNGTADSSYKSSVLSFINDKDIRGSYNYVKKFFPNSGIEELTPQVNDCIKRFNYHFPKRKLPSKLITCLSGWNYSGAYTDSALVLGLDMYLGEDCIYYQMLQLPQYRTRFMNKNYILPDLMRVWLITEFDNSNPTNTLLYHTIFYGKLFYSVNALLPKANDTLLLSYTSKQLNYCKEYEKKLWGYFAEKNRLYENNMKTVQELTSEGPFTGAISKDCPPRIAMWMGLQIVRSYMKNNDVTLEQLMSDNDAQKILSKSKYRP